mmetsp:Transcript_97959/g.281438  ORF Transcript_97959/g.281438 Transcript_97959/m.281438 type:complete len:286 (-) Transcript_97959:16-873(-)
MDTTSGDFEAAGSFQIRSPNDLLIDDSCPDGCRMRTFFPSPYTTPPAKRILRMSASTTPCRPPSMTGAKLAVPSAAHSAALHWPSTAVKTVWPMSRQTEAPQPSMISGWFVSNSTSRSSNVLTKAACTLASSAASGDSSANLFNSLVWKFRAQNSAAIGPGSPAHDWPSKIAYRPMGALLLKTPVLGCSNFILVPILFKSFTRTCLTRGFCPAAPPRETASTRTFGASGGIMSISGRGWLMGIAFLYGAINSRALWKGISTLTAMAASSAQATSTWKLTAVSNNL